MKLYKVLNKDMTSPFQSFQFEVGKEYICPEFDTSPKRECSTGFYATGIDGLAGAFNIHRDVWACQVGGRAVEINQFKRRYEKFKLLRRLSPKEVKSLADAEDVGYNLGEVLFPVNPMKINRKDGQVSPAEIELVQKWDAAINLAWESVPAAVAVSVAAAFGSNVLASVWTSTITSIAMGLRVAPISVSPFVDRQCYGRRRAELGMASVAPVANPPSRSVKDFVWGYIGSLFPAIEEWEFVVDKGREYPFQPAVDLWYKGLFASFSGNRWRLQAGEHGAIVWQAAKKRGGDNK